MIWNKFLVGVASNPNMTKKEVCNHLGLKVGTINSIQQHYKLQSPFYFNKPKAQKKKNIDENDKEHKYNKKEETFNKSN
jgi:hypothetical protein